MKYTIEVNEDQNKRLLDFVKGMGVELKSVENGKEIINKREFPRNADVYYYINSEGLIKSCVYFYTDNNIYRNQSANCFQTKKEAQFELERRKVWHELSQFAETEDDWKDCCFQKDHWCIGYDIGNNNIVTTTVSGEKYAELYFATKTIAKKAIDEVGEDRVKKYYLGISTENRKESYDNGRQMEH